MTRASMLALLREVRVEGGFNDWPELDKAIAWLEDEGNAVTLLEGEIPTFVQVRRWVLR